MKKTKTEKAFKIVEKEQENQFKLLKHAEQLSHALSSSLGIS